MPNVSGTHPDIPASRSPLPVPLDRQPPPEPQDPSSGAPDHRPLSESVAHGARWMAVTQVSTQVLRFATNIVLAHVLVPTDFGLVAIGMTVTMFLEQIRDAGTGAAVIQRREVSQSLLNTIFYLNAGMGILLGVIVFGAASPLAGILGSDHGALAHTQATHVLQAFAGISVITSGANIHHALLRRNMRFQAVGTITSASALVNAIVSVALALAGAGVWSIVIGLAAGNVFGVAAAWISSGWRPTFQTRMEDLQSVWKFSSLLLLTNLVAFALQQSDRIVINRALGFELLGIYAVALQITTYPLSAVTSGLTEVLFPAFARLQDDKAALRDAYVRANRVIALITFPLMAGSAAVAPLLVPVVLGEKWRAAIPIVIALAPAAALRSITDNAGILMLSLGHARATFLSNLAFSVMIVAGFIVGVQWGLVGMCITYTVLVLALTPLLWWVAFRFIDLRLRDYARALLPVTAIALVMVAAVVSLRWVVPDAVPPSATLFLQILLGAVVYLGLVVRLRPAAYVDAMQTIRGRRQSQAQAPVAPAAD